VKQKQKYLRYLFVLKPGATTDGHVPIDFMVNELMFLWRNYGTARPSTLTKGAQALRREVRREVRRLKRGLRKRG
jgi:hypothetical protein